MFIILLLLSMLHISRSRTWVCQSFFFYLQLRPLAPNIFSWFLNHQGAVFFFLLLSLTSSVLQWNHEGNFFLQCDQTNWLFYVEYYLKVSFSIQYVHELVQWLLSLTILCSPFSSSPTFRSSPNISAPIFKY